MWSRGRSGGGLQAEAAGPLRIHYSTGLAARAAGGGAWRAPVRGGVGSRFRAEFSDGVLT